MPKRTTYDVSKRYFIHNEIIPANTPIQQDTWDLSGFVITEMRILFPNGHVGLTGIRFGSQGTPILPWDPALPTIQGNDERLVFQMDFHVASPITVTSVNQDDIPHIIYCIAECEDPQLTSDLVPTTIAPLRL